MLIRKIEVRNFRRLGGPVVIDGLGAGVNIIAGDNEEGKSTLLHAIKAAIFSKHTSRTQDIKDFLPYNGAARPEIGLHFEIRNKAYSIQKAFLNNVRAEFRSPEGTFAGLEAEEKIRELFVLNSPPNAARKTGKKAVENDIGIWGLLWLEQGSAEKGLQTNDGGRETLMRALENDLSTIVGGKRGRALQKVIATQYNELYGVGGKEKIALTRERDNVNRLKEQLDGYREKYNSYKKKLEQLLEAQEQLAGYEKDKILENLRLKQNSATDALAAIDRLKPEVEAEKQKEIAAQLQWQNAKQSLDDRVKLSDKSTGARTALDATELKLAEAEQTFEDEKKKLEEANALQVDAQELLNSTELLCQEAQYRDDYKTASNNREQANGALKKLEDLEKKLLELEQSLAAFKMDNAAFAKITKLEKELLAADARATGAATKVVLKPLPLHKAFVEGKEIDCSVDLSINKATTLKLDDWGELDVIPGGDKTAEYALDAQEKKAALETTLAHAGVKTVEEAEQLNQERLNIENEIKNAKSELEQSGGRAALSKAREQLASLDLQLKSMPPPAQPKEGELRTLEVLRAQLLTVKTTASRAGDNVSQLKERLNSANILKAGFLKDKENHQHTLAEAEDALKALSNVSIESLEKSLSVATEKLTLAKAQSETKRQELAKLNEVELRSQQSELKKEIDRIEKKVRDLNDTKIRLTAEINMDGKTGLGEEMEKCEGEFELAQKDFERTNTHALALKLLHETLLEAEEEGKSQVLQPVLDIVGPKLGELFPGAKLILDNSDIEISHLVRDGRQESYSDLSMGTREQLSVLTRVAMAQLLKRQGMPAALVLDDALVYSDETRIASMLKLLDEVSKEIQILILTCRLHDYRDMPGASVIELARCTALAQSR